MFNKLKKILLAFLVLSSIVYGASEGVIKAVKVSASEIKAQDIKQTLQLTGSTQPTQTARISSPSEGPVERCRADCYVREGDSVTKGQSLLSIGNRQTTKAQLNSAEQAFREQEAELKRVKVLVEQGAIAESALEGTLSKYENAKANLIKAQETLSDYTLKAPWDGIVSLVHVREGDYVAPRAPLVEIYDPSSIVILFNVPEQYSMQLDKNLAINILLDAYPNKAFQAKITRIYPQLDPKTHTRAVEAKIQGDIALIPQMFARVEIVLQKLQNALSVPAISILKDKENKTFVFVAKENKAYKQEVKLGFEIDGRVLVLDGVNENDQIITAGFQNLKDGMSVSIVADKSK